MTFELTFFVSLRARYNDSEALTRIVGRRFDIKRELTNEPGFTEIFWLSPALLSFFPVSTDRILLVPIVCPNFDAVLPLPTEVCLGLLHAWSPSPSSRGGSA
jgi:hypothetical protein